MPEPPLWALHAVASLSPSKLEQLRKTRTEDLLASLLPGGAGALKARPDGTITDGHHRVHVLRERGIDVDALPREVVMREASE